MVPSGGTLSYLTSMNNMENQGNASLADRMRFWDMLVPANNFGVNVLMPAIRFSLH